MSQNPLQQYFRQPKIFVSLPSHGVFNPPGVTQGDVENMPVFGMTGMDEVLMKTPDALLTGESTVSVIQSCCPFIKNAWEISFIDVSLLLVAIRIATHGNFLSVTHVCKDCKTENEYDINLSNLVEYFQSCKYNTKLVLDNLIINTKPLTYRQTTEISLKNFQLQQKLKQIALIEDELEKPALLTDLFKELGELQNEIYLLSIESIDTGSVVVTEKPYIAEWLAKCEKSALDAVKYHMQTNQTQWETPKQPIKCTECGAENEIFVELDQSSFFVSA